MRGEAASRSTGITDLKRQVERYDGSEETRRQLSLGGGKEIRKEGRRIIGRAA